MSFWTDGSVEPKRNYRYLVTFTGTQGATENKTVLDATNVIWFAKNVTVPSFNVTSVTHDFLDNKYYYPGRVEWQTISLTLVDPVSPDAVEFVNEILTNTGYKIKGQGAAKISTGAGLGATTISKSGAIKAGLGNLTIDIINENGESLEQWKLQNPFIESAKFGDLDYTNDELRTVELTIKYDWATCDVGVSKGDPFYQIKDT